MRVAFVGEALIDFTGSDERALAFQGHAGGSPLNAAVACARLGQSAAYVTQLSTDLFGEQLLQHLEANGIDTRFVSRSGAPSTLAFVERGPTTNRYAFFTTGSADGGWSPEPLPSLPPECCFLHFGSISLLREPGATAITEFVRAHAGRVTVVFDPNVRTSLIADLPAYRERFSHWLALTDLLKLSDEDVAAIAPDMAAETAIAGWLARAAGAGPQAVVFTCGAQGATLYRQGKATLVVTAPTVEVRDTIGAGDTFGAALTVGLIERGVLDAQALHELPDALWLEVLHFAAEAAALNCAREGADPPRRAELQGPALVRRGSRAP